MYLKPIATSVAREADLLDTELRYASMFRMSRAAWRHFEPHIADLGFNEHGECRLLDRLWHSGRKSMRDLLAMTHVPAAKRDVIMAQIERGELPPWDMRTVAVAKVVATHENFAAIVATAQTAFIGLEQFQHITEVSSALKALERLQQRIVCRVSATE